MAGDAVETLRWMPVEQELPDADITVLCWLEPMGEWFAGYWDGCVWRDAALHMRLDNVTLWAEPGKPNVLVTGR
jgi:hypothetical protein